MERGLAQGSVLSYKAIDLSSYRQAGESNHHVFGNYLNEDDRRKGIKCVESLDDDGLPHVGTLVHEGDPLYCVIDMHLEKAIVVKHKNAEPAYIDLVRMVGVAPGESPRAGIKLRYRRNPSVGDKHATRQGQKGTMSFLWPDEDMPFSDSGISPDFIINPHALPSRMTIAMLLESIAGKAGALHGHFQDATPFRFTEEERASDFFGRELAKAGFDYYGTEPLYSGISGELLEADVFIGPVYYQRLRHMVSDKFQARAEGAKDALTQQPIGGRKRGGGVRFGEMERDSLLAHGTSFLLNDRLLRSSDFTMATVCSTCGSALSPTVQMGQFKLGGGRQAVCRFCQSPDGIETIAIPFVFLFLMNELAAMNIRVSIDLEGKK